MASSRKAHPVCSASPPPGRPENCADALDDGAFFLEFENGRLSKDDFGHTEHIRLAFIYLARYSDLAEAALRFRQALRRFVNAQGVAHIYNETLTWAYLVLMNQRMHKGPPSRDSLDFLERNADLKSHRNGLLSHYYDVEEISRSSIAKELFLLPSSKPREPTAGG